MGSRTHGVHIRFPDSALGFRAGLGVNARFLETHRAGKSNISGRQLENHSACGLGFRAQKKCAGTTESTFVADSFWDAAREVGGGGGYKEGPLYYTNCS